MSEVITHIYEITRWYEYDLGEERSEVVGLLFMNSGYNTPEIIEQYLDGDEQVKHAGTFKSIAPRSLLNLVPPIYRIEVDD